MNKLRELSPIFVQNVNKICGFGNDNLIYSLITSIDSQEDFKNGIAFNSLDNAQSIIDSGIEIFTGKKTGIAKNSYVLKKILEAKDETFLKFSNLNNYITFEDKVSNEKINVALAVISSIYFQTFEAPTQFFLPQTSLFSGHWEMWDRVNYLQLQNRLSDKNFLFKFRDNLQKSNIWKIKFKPEDFPEIVRRRLAKENLFDKKLDSNAMIKAMIVRMGELAKPSIDYEVIDFSIRSFFTYLGVKKYIRVDREIAFLRKIESEIMRMVEQNI